MEGATKISCLLNGLDIINEYEYDPWLSADEDVLFVGKQDGDAFMKMKEEDLQMMRGNRWRRNHSMRCWMFKLL